MDKKKALLLLWILAVPASLVSFYAVNMLLSDVANMFYMTVTKDVISSLPFVLFGLSFSFVWLSLYSAARMPEKKEEIFGTNAVLLLIVSAAGALCSVLSGTMIYGSMLAPYPFPGASVILLLLHLLTAAVSVYQIRKSRGMRLSFKFGSLCIALLKTASLYYTFNCLGAVLWAFVYAQQRTLYKTVWFYLFLLMPAALLFVRSCYRLEVIKKKKKWLLTASGIVLLEVVLLSVIVLWLGRTDTEFVSAISPALGVERLLGLPVIVLLHTAIVTVLSVRSVIMAGRLPADDSADARG